MKYLLDIAIFAIYILSSGFGLAKMKEAERILTVEFLIGFAFYGSGFIWWIVLLRRLPLSVAFPLAAGGLIVFVQFIGIYYLKEAMNALQLIGVSAVIAGIAMIYMSAEI